MRLALRPEEGGGGISEQGGQAGMPEAEGGEGQQQPGHPLALGEEDGAADPPPLGLDRERGEEGERGEGEQDRCPSRAPAAGRRRG